MHPMTRLFRTPRWTLGIFCGLLGTALLAVTSAHSIPDSCSPQVPSLTTVVGLGEEAAEPSSRESAVKAQRGAHLSKVGVERWHQAGYRGQGVKVAVLDSGFRGWKNHLGKSLPAKVATTSFRTDAHLEAP